jgi:HEAT repeat protein
MFVRTLPTHDDKRSHIVILSFIRRAHIPHIVGLALWLWGAMLAGLALADEDDPLDDSLDYNEVVSELLSDDPEVQHAALFEMRYRGDSVLAALPTLVQVITQANPEIRLDAMQILAGFRRHGKPAVKAISELLRDANAAVRIAAADALLKIDGPSEAAVAVLSESLRDDVEKNRLAAARVIRDAGLLAEGAVQVLSVAAGDRSSKVRAEVAPALGEAGARLPAHALPALRRLLSDDTPQVRVRAASALWQLDEPAESLLPTLIAMVADQDSDADRSETEELFWDHELPGRVALKLIAEIGPEAKPAVPTLIATIENSRPVMRFPAVDALGAMGPEAETAIKQLSGALRDTKVHSFPFAHHAYCLSDSAGIALRGIGPASSTTLIDALGDADERVVANAANALGCLPNAGQKTVAALVETLNHSNESVRAMAAYALGRIGPAAAGAAPELASRLNDDGNWTSYPGGGIGTMHSVGAHVLAALTMISPQPATIVPSIVRELKKSRHISDAMCEMLRRFGPSAKPVVPDIEPLLNDDEEWLPAALALVRIVPEDEALLKRLRTGLAAINDAAAAQAARGLGDLGKRAFGALPEMYLLLDRETEPSAKAVVAAAILRIDRLQPKAVVELATGLQDSGYYFRWPGHDEAVATWRSLGKDAGPAIERLIKGLQREPMQQPFGDPFAADEQSRRRLRCAELLIDVSVQRTEVIDALIELCESDSCTVRGMSSDALGRLGPVAAKAAPALVRMLPDREFYVVGGDFYGNGGTHFEPGERAMLALIKLGSPAVAPLQAALKDDDRFARQRAGQALGAIGEAAKPAVADLTIAMRDRCHMVRAAAAEALGSIHDTKPFTVALLIDAAADRHLSVRVAAASALAKLGPAAEHAEPALKKMRDDPFLLARNAADAALQTIAQK